MQPHAAWAGFETASASAIRARENGALVPTVADEEAAAGAAAGGAAAGGATGGLASSRMSVDKLQDALAELFDECVRRKLLSEATVDALTDRVATGATSDAWLYDEYEWSAKLCAHRAGDAGASAADGGGGGGGGGAALSVAGSSRCGTTMRVRFRSLALGAASEAGARTIRPAATRPTRAGLHGPGAQARPALDA